MYKQLTLCFALVVCSLMASSSFGQNISADPLTGKASVSIPIWTINSGDISSSISLSYYGNPKVNDSEGSAGMGWSLNGVGAVYREVRSLPDDFVGTMSYSSDFRNGWLHGNIARTINAFTPTGNINNTSTSCSTELNDYNMLDGLYNSDSEPDIFSFQAPGLSGQFVFDKNKVIQTMPYQDLKIQVTRNASDSLISKIVITNNRGVQYTFQSGDKTNRVTYVKYAGTNTVFSRLYNLYHQIQPIPGTIYYSSWYLMKITSPSGGVITYGYDVNSSTTTIPNYHQAVNTTTNNIDTLFVDNFTTTSMSLQAITGSNEMATFTWAGSVLSSVSINDLTYNTVSKNFNLQYHYVKASKRVSRYGKTKRAFLSGLMETMNCNAFSGYSFQYYGVNFLRDTTSITFNSGIGQDLFGYYDSTATSAVPDIYVKNGDSGTDGERYRIAQAPPNYSLMSTTNGGRVVDPKRVFYGSLKSVTFPSGGTTTIIYEAADYYDALTSLPILGGGARVKMIKTNDPADGGTTYKYRTTSGLSSGQWVYRPMFVAFNISNTAVRIPYNLAPTESILYSRVEVSTSGRGKTVYEFQNSGMYATASSGDFNATLTRIARNNDSPCDDLGMLRSGYYTYPHAPNTNYDFERGLPTRITDFTRAGMVVQRKLYTYQRTTLTTTPVSGISFDVMNGMYQFGKYSLLTNVNKVTATETSRVYDQADTTKFIETVSSYGYNGYQMLSQVSTTNSDNAPVVQTFKYAKDYATTGTDTQSQMIDSLVNSNRHGTLIESVSYNGSSVTDAALTLFKAYPIPYYNRTLILPSQQLILANPAGFINSTVSGNSFTYSPNYYTAASVDAYDLLGHATIVRDQRRAVKSSIFGYNKSAVALDIANASYDQVVFTDFEPGVDVMTPVTVNASTIQTDYWSGKYCGSFLSGNYVFQNSVTRGLGKNYRFSCWAKASVATTLTLSINGTAVNVFVSGVSSNSIPYPNAGAVSGTWQYIECTVDMSAVTPSIATGTSFSFKAITNGNILLDNVVFYPESASVLAHAYEPLNGKTADLDSRGVSGFKEYDALGRPRYVRNMDKDIVQIKDYRYAFVGGILPVSNFAGKATPNQGTATTYTAYPSCTGEVTYAWYVDGVQLSTASTFTYTFSVNKTYRLALVASSTYGSTSTEMDVNPVPLLIVAINVSGPTPIGAQYCDDMPTWTLTANLSGCYDPNNLSYYWYYIVGSNPTPNALTNPFGSTISSISFGAVNSTDPTTVYCRVTSKCANQTTGNIDPEIIGIGTSPQFQCRMLSGAK